MASSSRSIALVLAVYAAATLLMAWPLIGHFSTQLPHDTGDPAFVSWVFWWNAHATPLTDRWWNAPIFFPVQGAFAFSESILSLTPLTTPLQWLGATPVFTYNVVFVLSFFLAAICSHALAYRLTGRHDAALLAGLAYGFSPYRISQLPHLQILISWWMPLGLFALHRYFDRRRARDLALFGACWCLNGLSSGYLLVFFAVLVTMWVLWYGRTVRDFVAVAATLVVATVPMAPILIGYQHRHAAFGFARGMQEIERLSAQLQAFWTASPEALAHYWTFASLPEGELYPGVAILVLALAGVAVAWRRLAKPARQRGRLVLGVIAGACAAVGLAEIASGGWQPSIGGVTISLTHPYKIVSVAVWFGAIAVFWDRRWLDAWRRRSTFAFYGLAAAVAAVLALGPAAQVFDARFLQFAPYSWLMALPGGHTLRVPARFGLVTILCLAQLGAMAYARFFPRPRIRAAFVLCAAAIFVDGWLPRLTTASVPLAWDLTAIDPGRPILVLPRRSLYDDTEAMLRETVDDHPLINGYSGYLPPHDDVLRYAIEHDDVSVVQALQRFGAFLIVIDRARDEGGRMSAMVERIPGVALARQDDRTMVYRVPAVPAPVTTLDPRVSIASVRIDGQRLDAVADGQLGTLWEHPKPQATGQSIEIELGRVATVSRVELDLGRAPMEYPRHLRVTGEAGQTLWEGGTAGLTVLGAIADPGRVAIDLDVAVPTPTSRLTLTLTGPGYDDLPWALAELRVYGK